MLQVIYICTTKREFLDETLATKTLKQVNQLCTKIASLTLDQTEVLSTNYLYIVFVG